MHGSPSPADRVLLVGMEREVGIVASQILKRRISWDTLVVVHKAQTTPARYSFRLPHEDELARRLHESLTEQFGRMIDSSSVIETLITTLMDRQPSEWPAKLKELAGTAGAV